MTPTASTDPALLLLLGAGPRRLRRAPDEAAVREVLNERLAAALKPPVTEVTSFRRLGSGPLPAAADGKARRIVYYNAILKLTQDVDFASWNGLNATAFATLLGATEKGVIGIKQGGNKTGDELRVHGSATFVDEDGTWQRGALGGAGGGRRLAREQHRPAQRGQAAARRSPGAADRRRRRRASCAAAIVAEELAKAYGWMQLRVDRLDRRSSSPAARRAASMPASPRCIAAPTGRAWPGGRAPSPPPAASRMSAWSASSWPMSAWSRATSRPRRRRGRARSPPTAPWASCGRWAACSRRRSRSSTARDSPIASIADLKGKRVEIGQPGSGTRPNAEAVLAASGVALADLAEVKEAGLAEGLRHAGGRRGRRRDHDPGRPGPQPAAGGGRGRASSCSRSARRSGRSWPARIPTSCR